MTETMAQFARRLGVARSTITRAAKAGRLVLTTEGHINIEPSLERWHATRGGRIDMEQRHAAHRGAGIPQPDQAYASAAPTAQNAPHAATWGATAATGDGTEATRTMYKAITLHYDNSMVKLEMALRRHQRYPLDAVKQEALTLGGTLRAAIERLIDETAPRLALRKDPAERRRLLRAEAHLVARLLKTEQLRALRRLRR